MLLRERSRLRPPSAQPDVDIEPIKNTFKPHIAVNPPRKEKARGPFAARASRFSLDDANVPVICPTGQILTKRQPRKSDKLKPLSCKIRLPA
jgi:hypothetical protein